MSSEQGSGQELNRDTEDNDDGHRRASDQWKSPTPNEAQSTRIFGSDLNNSHVLSNTCSGRDEIDDPSWCAMKPMDDVGLLYHNREPLRLKDFATEVRAPMDVEQFAHQAELLLDPSTVSMGEIVTHMLEKVVENEGLGSDKLADIRASIFVGGSSTLMARTIQGVLHDAVPNGQTKVEADGGQTKARQAIADEPTAAAAARASGQASGNLKHDQSWLCALCSLSQISRRHMVIARFRQPINMGENAHHVRLFVLILVPTKEKSTKNQLETGRTFATMLTSSKFRLKLMEAKDETEFKSLLIIRAQQLAQANKLKNRHKYMLDAALHESISSSQLSVLHGDPNLDRPRASFHLVPRPKTHIDSNNNAHDQCDDLSPVFSKNPRTSKLFELITAQNGAEQHKLKHLAASGAQMEKIDLARVEAAAKGKADEKCCVSKLCQNLEFGKSAWQDFKRRLRYYPSDFRDAFVGPPKTIQKTISTIWFLYFGILLPTIAFSSLNTTQTHGHMGNLRKALIGQAIGGLGFALLSGQPLVIIMTTAPLCLYTKVIHQMCLDYGFPFPAMYAAVGLWNGFFLILYSLFGFSRLMKWCTRSTEEIFALFIVVAFVTDATKDVLKNFRRFYYTPACSAQNNQTTSMMTETNRTLAGHILVANATQNDSGYRDIEEEIESSVCRRETSLLFVLLMLGTVWLSVTLYKFRRTQYLSVGMRDLLADYALPTAVILMSLLGSIVFDDIYVEKFPPLVDINFERAPVELLPFSGILTALALGFTLSLLFFMDQNISAAMVNAPQNRLKKGDAFHYDLLIVALLNGFLTLYGMPMMHGVLPHSPLHARSLADIEEQVEEGHLREVVVNARETRVTAIVAHLFLFGSLLLIPYPIAYIPRAVLNGLFLYMAITSLDGLQVFERIMLLFTEQSKYPPNHYIRRCPQRGIHRFTLIQLIQLAVMCLFGFSPINVVEMFFPVIILLMIPFRHKIVPRYIDEKYLDALDGKH